MIAISERIRVYDESRPADASVELEVARGRWRARLKTGNASIDRTRDFDTLEAARSWADRAVRCGLLALDRHARYLRDVAAVMDPLDRPDAE